LVSATLNRSPLIEDCAFHAKVFCDPCGEISKATKHVPISGDQFTATGLDVSERSKAVYLQFVDKLIGVERLYAAGKPYRAQIAVAARMEYSGRVVPLLSWAIPSQRGQATSRLNAYCTTSFMIFGR
jgi:hypothetical protein